ncbi:MAG: hypothetical protein NDJ90_09675 [Oligoflexia bacterium]|nr:hypothetical protein [Oligoflexia bacterium]
MANRSVKMSLPLLAVALLAVAGCKQRVEIKNGMVPDELMPYAQALVGEYRGQVERKANTLTIGLDGNRLVVTTSEDLLDPVCESQLGDLLTVAYKEKDKQIRLTNAELKFDPALCSDRVEGREVHITFEEGNPISFDLMLLDHYDNYYRCEYGSYPGYPGYPTYPYPAHPNHPHDRYPPGAYPGYPGYPGYPANPGQGCYWQSVPYYVTGHFVKN